MSHSSVSPRDPTTAFDKAVHMASQCTRRNLNMEDSKVEELVLKRCWLARYWGLAAKHGVYPHIAHKKHAVWAGFAPIPLEVVMSAGQKAQALAAERPLQESTKSEDAAAIHEGLGPALPTSCDENSQSVEMLAEGEAEESGIDSQILTAEEGLKELAAMRVEEAVLLKISQNQNPTLIWLGLSREQAQDIQFKQAWLVYYWKRAQASGVVEQDVAVERLLYWMNQANKPPTYEDAVNVHKGLLELRTLGVDSHEGRAHGHACLLEIPS